MNNKVSSVLNSIEKIDNLIMEADVSVSDAMSDVYSKQFKMEGNVTEDYINHEYYQESVIAGILIGGGIIAVLATAIVLITKHVKKSASGDPEKKNDTSTAAGVSLDKPEEFNKKVEQLKSELEKAGGKLTISDVGFDASKLKHKYDLIKELCEYAETFLKGTEDDEINGALDEFNKKLEEINGIDYKLSGEVEVTPASLDEIKSLAAPIQQMTAELEKVSKEFEKRSKENKNANTGEMDDAKKERFEKLKEGLNQINKGSTDLGKSVDNEFSIIRKYFEVVSKAAKEKDKPAQAESEKKSESEKSQETSQPSDLLLKQKISPTIIQWTQSTSNYDPNHPDVKLSEDEAYNIISDIHTDVVNHRYDTVVKTLRAKAIKDPEKAMLLKNLVEATINNPNVFETDDSTIDTIKSGLPELEKIAANAPSEEPKKDETKPESEEPKEGTNESGEKITISKDNGALYDLITSWSNIEKFKSALNGGNAIISGPINVSYNNESLLTNTGKTKGNSTKFEITFGSEEEKRLISSFLNILDNFLNNEELFNKIPPELQKKLIDAFDMFLKRNKEVIDNNGDEAWTNIRNKFNDLKEKYTGSKEKTDSDLIKNKLSTISAGDEETKTETKEKKNNVIIIAKNDNALYDLINSWKSLSAFESVFGNPSLAEKRIDRAYREESKLSAVNETTRFSRIQTIEMVSTNETYTNFVSNLDDTLKNINEHPDLLEKISDTSKEKLVDTFGLFFYRNKEAIDQHNNGMWSSILSKYEEMYNKYKGDNDSDNSGNNDYIIQDSGILYIYEFIFPDEDGLKKAINNVDEFNKNINDIENNSKQLYKITDKTEIEKELNILIQTLDIIEKGISFDNITNVAPLFVRVLKVIKEYTENSISISDSNPLYSKVTDIRNKVDELISEYSDLKPATPTDQNDSENTETTNTTDESTPETSQNTDESGNQNGSENSDENKKQPEPKIEHPTISGFNGLSDLVSELVSSGSIKRIVKNKKSGVDIDKLIANAYNAEKTLQNKGTLTDDNAVRVLSNPSDEEEMLEKINTALTNIMSDIKHFNNLTSQSKYKLVSAFEIFLNRNKFSGNGSIIDLKRNISKSLSFIKAKSNVNTGSAITAAQDTTTPQNDIDSNQQDQNPPQSQPESGPQPEPKSSGNTPPTQTEMAKLKNHTLVHDVVTEANQRDEDGVPMITNDMETELKNASEEHLMDFIGHFITELTGNHTMIETIPFTRRNIITLAAYAKQANKLLKSQNNLRDFLTQQYGYYKDPAQQEYIYKMAKLFAQDYNISVVLTDPSGKKEYINPTTTFN